MMKKIIYVLLACVLLASTASANLPSDVGIMGSLQVSSRNTSPLDQISGVQALFDVDATLSSSYSGSGTTWSNLIASPDDGSAQSAYNFTATGSPTFTGSAGDSAAYWALGGSNYFALSGSNTAALNNLHKTTGGGPFTFIIAFRTSGTIAATERLGGTCNVASGNTGVLFELQSTGTKYTLNQETSGTQHATQVTATFNASTDYLVAFAFNYTGTTFKSAQNAKTFTSNTLSSGASTSSPSAAFQIANGNASTAMSNGTRIYGAYLFNKALSDADLSNVVTVLNSRHARTYALLDLRPKTMFAENRKKPKPRKTRIVLNDTVIIERRRG